MSRSAASLRNDGRGQAGANWFRAGPQPASSGRSTVAIRTACGAHPGFGWRAIIGDSGDSEPVLPAAPRSLPAREGAVIVPTVGRMDNTPQESSIVPYFAAAA